MVHQYGLQANLQIWMLDINMNCITCIWLSKYLIHLNILPMQISIVLVVNFMKVMEYEPFVIQD
jgi:hypothetical protein